MRRTQCSQCLREAGLSAAWLAVMPHQLTFTYTESLLRRAVFAFWWRTVGVGFFVAMAVLAGSLVFLVGQGNRSWVGG